MSHTGTLQGSSVRVLIYLLFAIQLISMGAMEMSGPFWPVHLRGLTSSESVFSFASIAVYVGPMLGIILTSAFWGRIGDRYGHKLMMIRALAGLSLTQLGLALFSDIWVILLLRFFCRARSPGTSPRPRLTASASKRLHVGRGCLQSCKYPPTSVRCSVPWPVG